MYYAMIAWVSYWYYLPTCWVYWYIHLIWNHHDCHEPGPGMPVRLILTFCTRCQYMLILASWNLKRRYQHFDPSLWRWYRVLYATLISKLKVLILSLLYIDFDVPLFWRFIDIYVLYFNIDASWYRRNFDIDVSTLIIMNWFWDVSISMILQYLHLKTYTDIKAFRFDSEDALILNTFNIEVSIDSPGPFSSDC